MVCESACVDVHVERYACSNRLGSVACHALATHSRLRDNLKLRDAVLYLQDLHMGLRVPSDILVRVPLATLVPPTVCASLVGDTHLVVALDPPCARNTELCRD